MFSPTGYYATFHTTWSHGNQWRDTYPVVGHNGLVALVIDEDGTLKTVTALLDELREGGETPDEEGATFCVSLAVTPHPDKEEA